MSPQTRTIGRFSDAILIGRGGFGSVYRADDAAHGRQVAIKVLSGTLGETERRRFERERQTMGRLGSHPNIIPVHESGYTDEGEGYIVMELAPGGSLGEQVENQGSLDWREAAEVAIAVAGAAQAAHDQGVLHRDIKPDNILIDSYGNPRLTDFGIAAVAGNATATTSTTATLAHAAPELLDGQTSTVAVDIYAIGSTFYNLVIGRPPFMNPDDLGVTAMLGRALTQPPPDLRPLGVPPMVAGVIERSMAKEASGRQRSASEFAAELRVAIDQWESAPAAASEPPAGATVVATAPIINPDALAGETQVAPTGSAQYPLGAAGVAGVAGGTVGGAAVGHAGGGPPQQHGQGPQQHGQGPQQHGQGPQQHGQGPQQHGFTPATGSVGLPSEPAGFVNQVAFQPSGGMAKGRGSGPLLLALAAVLVLVAAVGAVLVMARGDGDGTATTDTSQETSATTPIASTEATTTSVSENTTTASVTTTAPATTAPATVTTVSTTLVASNCPVRIVDAKTVRFNVKICGDGTGAISYQGASRESGSGIQLPACFRGFGVFVAENAGFVYEVDTAAGFLYVIDAQDIVQVAETFLPEPFVDLSPDFTICI